jgi:tRNA A-37 threonylcarbamoyl transferase component Bud32
MSKWRLSPQASPQVAQAFASLEAVFALRGEAISHDPLSDVIRVELCGLRYYVKRYHRAGKGLRRFLNRQRIKAEWQNLKLFGTWGIATAPVIAYGLQRRCGAFVRGALITQEIVGSQDLACLAASGDARLQDRQWVQAISQQLARATRILHEHHFTHNDLKWRNLLVDEQQRLFFIDCPSGAFWWGPLLRHRIIKDLACLDKVGKYQLSRSQRLRFYLQYCRRQRLTDSDKRRIRQIVDYFEGRE